MESPDVSELKSLGSQGTEYKYEGADSSLLERFENPMKPDVRNTTEAVCEIEIVSPEFTSLCPKTGQPDFATIVVRYVPNQWCVESKSWKLYLGSFRNAKDFHETCVMRITSDLVKLLEPKQIFVQGQFTPRGGIKFWPTIFLKA